MAIFTSNLVLPNYDKLSIKGHSATTSNWCKGWKNNAQREPHCIASHTDNDLEQYKAGCMQVGKHTHTKFPTTLNWEK